MYRKIALIIGLALAISIPGQAQKKKKKEKEVEKITSPIEKLSVSGLKFRSIGPAITSGRISDIAVHPNNKYVQYVATSSGGVWKTSNNGTTYKPIFDRQGSYSIGCVTIAPSNPSTVWVGTGENNNQRSVAYGDGIYKSEDDGASWKKVGLEHSEHIGKIIVHPENEDIVYVAAIGPLWSSGGDRGVYKTIDGGKTWMSVLAIDEHTGVNDIVMDPRNPDILYAAAYQRRRHVFTYVGGGPASGIYKTKDGGKTWDKANKGLPGGDKGRIGLSISPANPEIIYAIVEAASGGGFFKSTNRGASWKKQSSHVTSGNYYTEIVAHPTDPEIVFSMDTWLQWTTNGGKSFRQVNERFKHVDNHSMWIDPDHTDHYIVGCDGGIYESFDGAKTWIFKANLPVTQFYKVAVDNTEPFYFVYGGTQDNFSLGGPSRTRSQNGIVNEDWFITNGGDGFESQIDPSNPNIVYAQSQYGGLIRFDKASGEQLGIQPKPAEGEASFRWNWDAPLAVSNHKDSRIYFAANKLFRSEDRGNTWETISGDLSKQIDRNTLKVMDRIQSIDAVAKNGSTSPYGTIVAFSESPLNQQLLFVGTDDGLIQITKDGGKNWTKIDVDQIPGAPKQTYVNFLLASEHDENTVYAIFNHHKYGDFLPYVYKSTDQGQTWSAISANLPKRGSAYSLAEDFEDAKLLFVGTEFGCFFTNDGGQYWKQLKAGLPTIAVRDIAIQKRETDLVLGTFGRGFYVLDNYAPLRNLQEEALAGKAKIFPVKEGLVFIESTPLGLRGNGFQGDSYFSVPNPSVGVTFTYYVKDKIKTLKAERQKKEKEAIKKGEEIRYPTYEELKAETEEEKPYLLFTIRDQSNNILKQIKTGHGTGVRRITWDARYQSVNPISLSPRNTSNPFAGLDEGILAMPGAYTVSLSESVNGKLQELVGPTAFQLRSLGGVTLPATDRAALLAFQREAQGLQRAISGANGQIRDMGNKLRYIEKAIYAVEAAPEAWLKDVKAAKEKMAEIQKLMYGDRLASRLDKASQPSINNRMGSITYEMWSSSSAPTQTHKDGLQIARKAFSNVLRSINALRDQDIAKLEDKLEKAGAPYTPGRKVEYGKQ